MTASSSNSNYLQYHEVGNFIHVLIKEANVSNSDLDIQIQKRRLTVVLAKGKNKVTLFEGLLYEGVDVGNCRTKIHDDHILIKLRKEDPSVNWPQLQLGGSAITTATPSSPDRSSRPSTSAPVVLTSLQRAQQSSNSNNNANNMVSPIGSPTRSSLAWSPTERVKGRVDSLQTSFSSLVSGVNKVLTDMAEEKRDIGEEKRDELEMHDSVELSC